MYEIGTSKIPSEQELAFDATLAKEPFVRERSSVIESRE